VIGAAVLRELGRAENAEGDVAGKCWRQAVKRRRPARSGAQALSLVWSVADHGTRGRLDARSLKI
jgi:hypothetical protein